MTTFKATTEAPDKHGLRAVLERYANDQWLPVHYTEGSPSCDKIATLKGNVAESLRISSSGLVTALPEIRRSKCRILS